jgi:hypothetical protein
MSEENGCGCGCGCDSEKEEKQAAEHDCGCGCDSKNAEELTNVIFQMDNEFLAEIHKAAEANGMDFQNFVLNSIELGLALTAGQVGLVDPETGQPFAAE